MGGLHPGDVTAGWKRMTDGMGVQEGRGVHNTPLLFAESIATLGLSTEDSDTPPTPTEVVHTTGTDLLGGAELQTPLEEAHMSGGVAGSGSWSYRFLRGRTPTDG